MSTTPEVVTTPPPAARERSPSAWAGFFNANNRYLPPLLITCILLVGQVTFGMLESWSRTALAIVTAIGMEIVLSRVMLGKWPHLASAYISGISVGILVRSPFFWPFALCSALSIMSKYVLRWRGQHLWNPSNFGLSALFFLHPAAAASLSIQWGNSLLPMVIVWCLGAVIIARLKRFHICLSYVLTFLLLSFVRSEITGNPWWASVAPLTGPMYQLFVFFMITDPKTTVNSRWGQCVVAALVAVAEMFLRLNEVVHAPYYALFLVGPVAKAIEMALTRARAPRADPVAPPAQAA